EFEANGLVAEHPPRWTNQNKLVVHAVASPPGAVHAGRIQYSRWAAMPLPGTVPASRFCIEAREGFFDYPGSQPGAMIWHLNFADPHLFGYYGGPLFAQDEMQVAEHPALASLKQALEALGAAARTVDRGDPTPVLVAGVERRCRVATEPDASAGRPGGLYGNAFAAAPAAAIRAATTAVSPPTISNIIALAAPTNGSGRYTREQLAYILQTAWSGFRAAALETARLAGPDARTSVHTGFWGCGAFGGNRTVMTALQLAAARLAGVDLVFFTGSAPGKAAFREGAATLEAFEGWTTPDQLLEGMEQRGLRWGMSDGN
ncbi:MAG TPA: hypothetical protein VK012_07105, partial [Gemmatimonadales bacterium]|nr:hypothetical protein [Gemmatimonadales bacterium]